MSDQPARLRVNREPMHGKALDTHFLHWEDTAQVRIVVHGYDYKKKRKDSMSVTIEPDDLLSDDIEELLSKLKWKRLEEE